MPKKPDLTIVGSTTVKGPSPPSGLGKAGRSLWQSIMNEYRISDSGGLVYLEQAARAADRAADCAEAISRDGATVVTKAGVRDHPLIRHELSARALVGRLLSRLNLDVEPLRQHAGRPPGGGVGITWRQLRDGE